MATAFVGSARSTEVKGYLLTSAVLTPIVRRTAQALFDLSDTEAEQYEAEPMLLINRDAGDGTTEYALVGTEGVGYKAQIWGLATVETLVRAHYSTYTIPVGLRQLIKLVGVKADAIPLSEHIRVFGDRLESNFSGWHYWADDNLED